MDGLIEAVLTTCVSVAEPVLVFAGEIIVSLLMRLVMLPIFCVAITPFVLIAAFFGSGRYAENVILYYKGFVAGCLQYGLWI